MNLPPDLYYHREHAWIKSEQNGLFRVGLDELFMLDLGEIERLDLPHEGDELSQDEVCGAARGAKTNKLFHAPLSGEVVEVNFTLRENLKSLVEDPYGKGWLMLIDPADPEEELDNLLCGEEAHNWWLQELNLREKTS